MRTRFRFVFIVFYLTAVLILTVYLRSASNRIFHKLYSISIRQNRLKQQLGNKQLRLENLINPVSVSQRLDERYSINSK
jgi:hypothetical protein